MITLGVVPLQPEPSQVLTIQLANQRCGIAVYEKRRYPIGEPVAPALYLDLSVSDAPVVTGVLLRSGVPVVVDAYLGFVGELVVLDTQGAGADPLTAGLGTRWVLGYVVDDVVVR